MKKGFTMIELLVVIAMLMVLMGSVTSALMGARKRAKIAKATTACQEMTNAILAYENYAAGYSLAGKARDAWRPANEQSLAFILGKESVQSGNGHGEIPVLYNNAEVTKNGEMLDPWGKPYMFRIVAKSAKVKQETKSLYTSILMPNYYRRRAGEAD